MKRKRQKPQHIKRPQEYIYILYLPPYSLINSYFFFKLWVWQSWTRSCSNSPDHGSWFLLWQIFIVPLMHSWRLSARNLQLSWHLLILPPAKNCSPLLFYFKTLCSGIWHPTIPPSQGLPELFLFLHNCPPFMCP